MALASWIINETEVSTVELRPEQIKYLQATDKLSHFPDPANHTILPSCAVDILHRLVAVEIAKY